MSDAFAARSFHWLNVLFPLCDLEGNEWEEHPEYCLAGEGNSVATKGASTMYSPWHDWASTLVTNRVMSVSQSVLTKYLSCSIYDCSNYRRGALRVLHRYAYLALKLRWLFIYIAGLLPFSSVFDVQVDSAADWRCGLVSISSLFNF